MEGTNDALEEPYVRSYSYDETLSLYVTDSSS
jgi:hypothetical protein